MDYLNLVLNVEPVLPTSRKSHVVTVYNVLHALLDSVNILFRIFTFAFMKDTGQCFFFLVMSLSGFGFRVMLAS